MKDISLVTFKCFNSHHLRFLNALIGGGGGGGGYIHIFVFCSPDEFLLKSVVFKFISKEISRAVLTTLYMLGGEITKSPGYTALIHIRLTYIVR